MSTTFQSAATPAFTKRRNRCIGNRVLESLCVRLTRPFLSIPVPRRNNGRRSGKHELPTDNDVVNKQTRGVDGGASALTIRIESTTVLPVIHTWPRRILESWRSTSRSTTLSLKSKSYWQRNARPINGDVRWRLLPA